MSIENLAKVEKQILDRINTGITIPADEARAKATTPLRFRNCPL
jgi:hypothetical protein